MLLSKLSDCFSHNRLDGGGTPATWPPLSSKNRNSRTLSLTQLRDEIESDYASAEQLAGNDITKCVPGSNYILFPDN